MNKVVLTSKDTEKKLILSRDDLTKTSYGITEVITADQADLAGDVLKGLKKWASGSEAQRKEIVKPFNDGVKAINANFKVMMLPISTEVARIDSMLKKYLQAKAERERKLREEEEARLLAEAEKASQAAALAEDGAEKEVEQQTADALLDTAVKVSKPPSKSVRSTYGTTTTLRDNWKGEVSDLKCLLAAIVRGEAPENLIQINQAEINRVAKQVKEKGNVPGIRFYNDQAVFSR